MSNDYKEDLQWASSRSLDFDALYGSLFDTFERVPDDTLLQVEGHVDLIATRDGITYYLEEKLVREDYKSMFVEVFSSTTAEDIKDWTKGWLRHTYPDNAPVLLHYAFTSSSVLLDFKKFHAWVMPRIISSMKGNAPHYRDHTMSGGNMTKGYLVPVADIPADVWFLQHGSASYECWHTGYQFSA